MDVSGNCVAHANPPTLDISLDAPWYTDTGKNRSRGYSRPEEQKHALVPTSVLEQSLEKVDFTGGVFYQLSPETNLHPVPTSTVSYNTKIEAVTPTLQVNYSGERTQDNQLYAHGITGAVPPGRTPIGTNNPTKSEESPLHSNSTQIPVSFPSISPTMDLSAPQPGSLDLSSNARPPSPGILQHSVTGKISAENENIQRGSYSFNQLIHPTSPSALLRSEYKLDSVKLKVNESNLSSSPKTFIGAHASKKSQDDTEIKYPTLVHSTEPYPALINVGIHDPVLPYLTSTCGIPAHLSCPQSNSPPPAHTSQTTHLNGLLNDASSGCPGFMGLSRYTTSSVYAEGDKPEANPFQFMFNQTLETNRPTSELDGDPLSMSLPMISLSQQTQYSGGSNESHFPLRLSNFPLFGSSNTRNAPPSNLGPQTLHPNNLVYPFPPSTGLCDEYGTDGEHTGETRSRKKRKPYTRYQTMVLENEFLGNAYITRQKRWEISCKLNLTERQIEHPKTDLTGHRHMGTDEILQTCMCTVRIVRPTPSTRAVVVAALKKGFIRERPSEDFTVVHPFSGNGPFRRLSSARNQFLEEVVLSRSDKINSLEKLLRKPYS
ncbi:hypothetical protein CSKR_101696 [Clonorchis sinensis]|uniref:Homeobox domain-containing protein n=1 Tax=Clonorchis sinensis TaxID=79923 RepID=A0A8T1MNP6_CLOSI|nr:hypothetical protein CSKR_101696 [Clonorchis sinensis]